MLIHPFTALPQQLHWGWVRNMCFIRRRIISLRWGCSNSPFHAYNWTRLKLSRFIHILTYICPPSPAKIFILYWLIHTQLDKTEPLTWFIEVDHFKQFLITHALIIRPECFKTECALYVKPSPLEYVRILFNHTPFYARCQGFKGYGLPQLT